MTTQSLPSMTLTLLSLAASQEPSLTAPYGPHPTHRSCPPSLPSQRGWHRYFLANDWTEESTGQQNPQYLIQSWEAPANRILSQINNLHGWQGSREIAWLVAETDRISGDSTRAPPPTPSVTFRQDGGGREEARVTERISGVTSFIPLLPEGIAPKLSPEGICFPP